MAVAAAIAAATLAVALLAAPGASAAPPGGTARAVAAAAPESLSDCPDNNMCAWQDANYSGRHIEMTVGCSDFYSCFKSNFADAASSLANYTNYEWCFYTLTNYLGRAYPVTAAAEISYVGNTWNDEFESAHAFDLLHTC